MTAITDEQIDACWSVAVRRNGTTTGTIRDTIRAILALTAPAPAVPSRPLTFGPSPIFEHADADAQFVLYLGQHIPEATRERIEAALKREFVPAVPSTGERDNLHFVCANGCGFCGVKLIDFEAYRSETLAGDLIERATAPNIVSDCCGFAVEVWDERKQDVTGAVSIERAALAASSHSAPSDPEIQQAIADTVGADWPHIGLTMKADLMPIARAVLALRRAAPSHSAPSEPTDLQARAIDLHEKAFMPWPEAEQLALKEAGISDADIDELIGNASMGGVESVLVGEDEIRQFTRSVLVHSPALRASLPDVKAACDICEGDPSRCDIHDCGDAHHPDVAEKTYAAAPIKPEPQTTHCTGCDTPGACREYGYTHCQPEPRQAPSNKSLIAALDRYLRRDETANATNSDEYRGGMLALTAAIAAQAPSGALTMPETPTPAMLYAMWKHRDTMRGLSENKIARSHYFELRAAIAAQAQKEPKS